MSRDKVCDMTIMRSMTSHTSCYYNLRVLRQSCERRETRNLGKLTVRTFTANTDASRQPQGQEVSRFCLNSDFECLFWAGSQTRQSTIKRKTSIQKEPKRTYRPTNQNHERTESCPRRSPSCGTRS